MSAAQITLGVLATISIGYTVWGYPRLYHALTARSRLYRTVGLALLDLLLLLILLGVSTDFHADVAPRLGTLRYVSFWTACLVLGLSLPLIGLLDALESFVAVRRERRDFVKEVVEEERARLLALAREKDAQEARREGSVISTEAATSGTPTGQTSL